MRRVYWKKKRKKRKKENQLFVDCEDCEWFHDRRILQRVAPRASRLPEFSQVMQESLKASIDFLSVYVVSARCILYQ